MAASALALAEYFETGDVRFLETLRETLNPSRVAALADRWAVDPRPWAREQIFRYLDEPLANPGHEPLVRRLFKGAEARGDHEIVGAFMVSFDALARRKIEKQWNWDRASSSTWTEEVIVTPSNTRIPNVPPKHKGSMRTPKNGRLFRFASRFYLRRRAWRYFRLLGYQHPETYLPALLPALRRYRDSDLAEGLHILDSWGLLNALYRHSPALTFGRTHINLVAGSSLPDLQPAPRFPELWKSADGAAAALDLVRTAQSRLVRVFAMDWIEAEHADMLFTLPVEELLALLGSSNSEVQQFAARALENAPGLATLEITTWMRLLKIPDLIVLQGVCDAFARHVTPDRLTVEDCIQLACARPTPVARIAFDFLQRKTLTVGHHAALATLSEAGAETLQRDLADFALSHVGAPETYDAEHVSRFLDSSHPKTRDAAWTWMQSADHARKDATLWARLSESPHGDIKLRLVDALEQLRTLPVNDEGRTRLWTAVLLDVHRGGRQKPKAIRQLCDAIAVDPDRMSDLLPVLAVAVRSLRRPEMRAGLSGLVTLLQARPDLADAVQAAVPEVVLASGEAV